MVTLMFHCESKDGSAIRVKANSQNHLYIEILRDQKIISSVLLDKSTAIKLSKELRKQIALLY